jgi:hypothetical protein
MACVFTSVGLGVVFGLRVMSLSDAIDSIADKCTEDLPTAYGVGTSH